MSLLPRPSDAELLRRARLASGRLAGGWLPSDMLVAPLAPVYPRTFGVRWATYAERTDAHHLTLYAAISPRTKKNHGRGVAKESAAYVRYRGQIASFIESCRVDMGFPMPDDLAFNCAAVFHVDNDRADTHGLMQGLADALQDAGVITNDRQLWTWDGTHQIHTPLAPRLEVQLSPSLHPPPAPRNG